MIIDKAQLVDTSGDRTVAALTVRHGGELKLITIDDELIIGHNTRNAEYDCKEMLWFATSWKDLVKHIGAANAVDVYKKFKAVWEWPVNIEDECDIQALESLIDLVSSASKLSDRWQYFLNDGYPFKEDFESLLMDLMNWQHTVVSKVENNDWED